MPQITLNSQSAARRLKLLKSTVHLIGELQQLMDDMLAWNQLHHESEPQSIASIEKSWVQANRVLLQMAMNQDCTVEYEALRLSFQSTVNPEVLTG